MRRCNIYTRQQLENIIDNLREDGCPDEALLETAHMMLNETLTEGLSDPYVSLDNNPFWEPTGSDPEDELDEELEEMKRQIGYPYNTSLHAFTCCSFA